MATKKTDKTPLPLSEENLDRVQGGASDIDVSVVPPIGRFVATIPVGTEPRG